MPSMFVFVSFVHGYYDSHLTLEGLLGEPGVKKVNTRPRWQERIILPLKQNLSVEPESFLVPA